jgi:hypothetical protein
MLEVSAQHKVNLIIFIQFSLGIIKLHRRHTTARGDGISISHSREHACMLSQLCRVELTP